MSVAGISSGTILCVMAFMQGDNSGEIRSRGMGKKWQGDHE
jgi:hypothetical protein